MKSCYPHYNNLKQTSYADSNMVKKRKKEENTFSIYLYVVERDLFERYCCNGRRLLLTNNTEN